MSLGAQSSTLPPLVLSEVDVETLKLDWKNHLSALKNVPQNARVFIIINGEVYNRGENLPLDNTSLSLPYAADQSDYYLELRQNNKTIHRSSVLIKEKFNRQNIDPASFKKLVENKALKIKLPKSITRFGYSGRLSDRAYEIGYEKISWALRPNAKLELRNFIKNYPHDFSVQLTMNERDIPVTVKLTDKLTSKVLRTELASEFYIKVDAAFSGNSFFWDDMLVGLATIPHHPWLVKSTLEFWLDVQKANGGTIPREVRKGNLKSLWFPKVIELGSAPKPNLQYTNPYLMDWVAEELYQYDPSSENLELLKRVAKSIEDYESWLYENRSVFNKNKEWMGFTTNALGSGLDNSRGMRGNFHKEEDYQAAWVDVLAQLISMQKNLKMWNERFLVAAKDPSEMRQIKTKIKISEKKIKDLEAHLNKYHWNEKEAFYFDLISDGHGLHKQDTAHFSIAGFFPLYSGSVPVKHLKKLVDRQFKDDAFGGDFPFPVNARHSLDRSDPEEDGYWDKWSHWPSMTAIAVEGLSRMGEKELAASLTLKFLRGMEEANSNTVAEFYGETIGSDGKITARIGQHGPHQTRLDFAGWGKVPPIYMLIKHVLGFTPGEWTIQLKLPQNEEIEIQNIELNGKKKNLKIKGEA